MNKITGWLIMLLCLLSIDAAALSQSTERRAEKLPALSNSNNGQSSVQAYQSHVWFHRIDLVLTGDINANGYYHRLEVEFDADTSLGYQQVFAEFSLLPTYGGERIYYTSSVFELYRDSADDWLAIDTVLDQRYPADNYLLTVRLYDASTGYLLAEISGFDDINLDLLPLEDYSRDSYIDSSTTVEVSAGSTGIAGLLALCLLLILRQKVKTG